MSISIIVFIVLVVISVALFTKNSTSERKVTTRDPLAADAYKHCRF